MKLTVRILIACLILVLGLTLAAPTILSTDWGTQIALDIVNRRIPGKISVEKLELGWMGPQKIEGLTLKDPTNQTVLTLKRGDADSMLMTLLRSPQDAKSITIKELNATIQVDQNGYSNLEKSLKIECCKSDNVSLEQPPLMLILQHVQGFINIARDEKPLEIRIEGESAYNTQKGKIALHMKLDRTVLEQILKHQGNFSNVFGKNGPGAIVADAQVDHFPVAIIDQVLNLSDSSKLNRAVNLLGETLTFSLDQTIRQNSVAIVYDILSSAMQFKGELLIANDLSHANLIGNGLIGTEAVDINIQAQLPEGLLTEKNALQKGPTQLQIALKHFPLKFFFPQEKSNSPLFMVLGEHLNVNGNLVSQNQQLIGNFLLSSDQLAESLIAVKVADQTTLTEPLKLTLHLDPLFASDGPLSTSIGTLQNEANLYFSIDSLSIPLSYKQLMSGELSILTKDLHYNGSINVTPLAFGGNTQIGNFTINAISGSFDAHKGFEPQFIMSAVANQADPHGYFRKLLGENTNLQATLSGPMLRGDVETPLQLTFGATSPLAVVDMTTSIDPQSDIELLKPATIRYRLESPAIQLLGLESGQGKSLTSSLIEFTISSWQIPSNLNDLSKIYMKGGFTIDTLSPSGREASLDDIRAQWILDGGNETIVIDFYGITRFGQEAAGQINGSITVENWHQQRKIDLSQANMRTIINARKLPTELIAFKYGGSDIAQIFGHAIDMNISAKFKDLNQPQGSAIVSIHSEHVAGNIALTLGDHIRLTPEMESAYFRFKLTPDGHASIRNLLKNNFENPFYLTDASTISVTLSSLAIPLPLNPKFASLEGVVEIDQLVGMDRRTQQRLSLESLSLDFNSPNVSNQINFKMRGQGRANGNKATLIHVNGTVDHLLDSTGALNRKFLSLTLDGTLEALPAPLLCKFFCTSSQLSNQTEALFGQLLDATIRTKLNQMSGPVYIQAKGTNGSFTMNGTLSEGYLFLNDDLKAHVLLTQDFGRYILQELVPITNGIIPSNQPLSLMIDKRGFALPVSQFSLETLAIGLMTIDIGKVQFSSKSQLASALSLLTPANADSLRVWLTPIYLSMGNGIVKIERADLLINERYPLAAWGHVDLVKEKVNMTIGLSGAAIASAFNMKNIPRSYLLQMPFKGPLDNPTLDKTRAAGRISALTAQTHGGPEGLVIGTVLDVLTGGLKEAAPPKPTTNPLPWQQLMMDTKESEAEGTKSPLKAPMDEITKGASSLIRNLINKKK